MTNWRSAIRNVRLANLECGGRARAGGRRRRFAVAVGAALRPAVWGALLVLSILAVITLLFWPGRQGPPSGLPPAPQPRPSPGTSALKPEPAPRVEGVAENKDKHAPSGRQELAEVELVVTLAGEKPDLKAATGAIRKLKELAAKNSEPAKSAALEWVARYEGLVDAAARQAAREAAERAEDLAGQGRFAPAVAELQRALAGLPDVSPWAQREGRARLTTLHQELSARKERLLTERRTRLEDALARGPDAAAQALVEELQRHADPDFQALGKQYVERLAAAQASRRATQDKHEEAGRTAWGEFFPVFDRALAEPRLDQAAALCAPAADSPLRGGGVPRPEEVLAGFASEVAGVKALLDAALQAAASLSGREVRFDLVSGQVAGTLQGVIGRQLVVLAGGRAEVKVPVERLACTALAKVLAEARAEDHHPTLAALAFARGELGSKESGAGLTQRYSQLGRPLPPHWAARFEYFRQQETRKALTPKLDALRTALRSRDPLAVRDALEAARPLAQAAGALVTPPERELLADAERLAARAKVRQLVLQNGRLPTAEYVGIQVDQISRYYKNQEKTDVDVQHGLRLGSYEDLQRILLRCDGLEAALGKGRVRRATLELYQTLAAPAEGATVGVFRLKREWTPDAGTWLFADQRRKLAWQKPGAGGPDDAALLPDAKLTFDGQSGLWRSWDITSIVRDILDAKAKNLGLLLRVIKEEPRYHLRFYPDGELEDRPDPALRPRLMVETESLED